MLGYGTLDGRKWLITARRSIEKHGRHGDTAITIETEGTLYVLGGLAQIKAEIQMTLYWECPGLHW
jgi:hypothetical protein